MSLKDVFSAAKDSFRFSKFVTIKDVKYGIAVLNMGQEKKVNAYLETLKQDDTAEYINELRRAIVAEAVVSINEEVLGKTVKIINEEGKEVEKDKAIAMKEFLTDLPTAAVSELFDTYVDVKDQSEDILKKEMKYDWFKTPEQRDKEIEESAKKEVASEKKEEDLNKKEEEIPEVKLKKVNETNDPEIRQ
jgi:hypothetical protein